MLDAEKSETGAGGRAVSATFEGRLCVIELARPDSANLLSKPMLDGLLETFDLIEESQTSVVVFRSQGEHFSHGRDFRDGVSAETVFPVLKEITERLPLLGATTIARVQGQAFGLAAGIATLCDFSIASDNAEIAFNEILRGSVPTFVLSYLGRYVRRKLAYELVSTGRVLTAVEARECGLLTRVVPREDLDSEVSALVGELLLRDPLLLQRMKRYARDIDELPVAERPEFALSSGLAFRQPR